MPTPGHAVAAASPVRVYRAVVARAAAERGLVAPWAAETDGDVLTRSAALCVDDLSGAHQRSLADADLRRTAGAFYTPAPLVDALLDATLDLVLDRATQVARAAGADPAEALLRTTVVDPACGAAAFLRPAAARIAARVAAVRGTDPAGELPEVVRRCVHGVDVDPHAAELARLLLWLDAGADGATPEDAVPGIRTGDALAGLDWDAEFPSVLGRSGCEPDPVTAWRGGFDVVVGNPPWERVKVQELEFFTRRDPWVAQALTAAQRRARAAEATAADPALRAELAAAKARATETVRAVRYGGRHPLTGEGDLNAYLPFTETAWRLAAPDGRVGLVVPVGVATDRTSARLFAALVHVGALVSLRVGDNRDGTFVGVGSSQPFALLVATGRSGGSDAATVTLVAGDPSQPGGSPWTLDAAMLDRVSPNTGSAPLFASARDASLVDALHRRLPVLVRRDPGGIVVDNPWSVTLRTPLHMTNDSRHFVREPGAGRAPLYEAKLASAWDHRHASYSPQGRLRPLTDEEKADPGRTVRPRFWVDAALADARYGHLTVRGWLAGFRNVTSARARRTLQVAVLPPGPVGNSLPLLDAPDLPLLVAVLGSLVCDYVARQKLGGNNLNFFKVEQLPVPPPQAYAAECPWQPGVSLRQWHLDRLLPLVHTARDVDGFARELGHDGPPSPWDADRRAVLTADLDAAAFHVYGLSRDEVEHVLSTFGALREAETARHGEFRTGRLVLERYEAFASAATRAGGPPTLEA